MGSKVSLEEINAFFEKAFDGDERRTEIIELEDGFAKVRLNYSDKFLRPGGVISGPTQMSMADTAMYAAIFTRLGITPMAVTSSLNMSFLRPCKAEDVIASCQLMKLGRKLAVGDVSIGSISQMEVGKPASHAIVTYAIPNA